MTNCPVTYVVPRNQIEGGLDGDVLTRTYPPLKEGNQGLSIELFHWGKTVVDLRNNQKDRLSNFYALLPVEDEEKLEIKLHKSPYASGEKPLYRVGPEKVTASRCEAPLGATPMDLSFERYYPEDPPRVPTEMELAIKYLNETDFNFAKENTDIESEEILARLQARILLMIGLSQKEIKYAFHRAGRKVTADFRRLRGVEVSPTAELLRKGTTNPDMPYKDKWHILRRLGYNRHQAAITLRLKKLYPEDQDPMEGAHTVSDNRVMITQ